MRASGTASRTRPSASSMARATPSIGRPGATAIFAATSSSSGPMYCVRMWMTRCTESPASRPDTILSSTGAETPSPISRLFISMIRMTAMTPSRMPMAMVPSASKTGLPVTTDSPTPSRARTSPIRAPKSSSSTTGSSGTLDWRMNCHQVRLPLILRDSTMAVRNE